MLQSIIKINNKALIILIFLFSFGNLALAENNITNDDAYQMAIDTHERGDIESSIKYLLLAEKLGNADASDRLCWICNHDKDEPLTKEWCSENNCLQIQ
jgi:hypothetical protein